MQLIILWNSVQTI